MNNLTTNELISVASRDATTDLEHELLRRLCIAQQACDQLRAAHEEVLRHNSDQTATLMELRDELRELRCVMELNP